MGATFGPHEFIRNLKHLSYSTYVILILQKLFTCPSGKLITEFTSPITKSASPGLSDTRYQTHVSLYTEDRRNFKSPQAICNLHLQLCTCVTTLHSCYMKNALIFNQSIVIFSFLTVNKSYTAKSEEMNRYRSA